MAKLRYTSFSVLASLVIPCLCAISFNMYDLGLEGVYPNQQYRSVNFVAPSMKFTRQDARCNTGNLLLTPSGPGVPRNGRGPVMLDSHGELIWMGNDRFKTAVALDIQRYRGEDYLTFWTKAEKSMPAQAHEHRARSYIMVGSLTFCSNQLTTKLDSSYEVAHIVQPHGVGMVGDSHEFRITPQNTALITIYHHRQVNCSLLSLGESCWIQDGVFQDIDIETGQLLFQWRSTDHVSLADVFSSPCYKDGYGTSKKDSFDYFHINSVDKLPTGDYLVSARYLHAVIIISGKDGRIMGQIGGKNNDFKDLDNALAFSWQHHAVWHGNNLMTLFDNHANNVFKTRGKHSRGMLIEVDIENKTASLLQSFVHPDDVVNVSQGSVQLLPESGTVLVGFGNSPTFIEYSRGGRLLCSTRYAPQLLFGILDFGIVKSYRIFKKPWTGRPKTMPDVVFRGSTVFVSWNGATEVVAWRLEYSENLLEENGSNYYTIQELRKDRYETAFQLNHVHGHVRVVALDKDSNILARSRSLTVITTSTVSILPCVPSYC